MFNEKLLLTIDLGLIRLLSLAVNIFEEPYKKNFVAFSKLYFKINTLKFLNLNHSYYLV